MGMKLGRTLREECRLRVFENRVLRRIFGSKTDVVTREGRRLHSEELYTLSSSSSSSSLGATALSEPWPSVLFASTGLYPELFFFI
jgi:hypothetical protein